MGGRLSPHRRRRDAENLFCGTGPTQESKFKKSCSVHLLSFLALELACCKVSE